MPRQVALFAPSESIKTGGRMPALCGRAVALRLLRLRALLRRRVVAGVPRRRVAIVSVEHTWWDHARAPLNAVLQSHATRALRPACASQPLCAPPMWARVIPVFARALPLFNAACRIRALTAAPLANAWTRRHAAPSVAPHTQDCVRAQRMCNVAFVLRRRVTTLTSLISPI